MDAKTMTMPNGDVINLKDDVARAKIGTGTLDTESKELIGAVNELKGTLTNKTTLTSTSHTVSGYYSQVGNVVFVSGNYKATSSGTETISLNIPSMGSYTYAVPFRSQTSGALGIIWVTASELRTYGKQGTIAVDDTINFSFCYILNS